MSHIESAPFQVKPDLFDHAQPETLGLSLAAGAETFTIFRPRDDSDKCSHGLVLLPFKGYLYAQWQSSSQDEDGADTWVAYSRSQNGVDWTEPMVLIPQLKSGFYTNGGWWADGEILVAYLNFWPCEDDIRQGGFTQYITSTDGMNWTEPQPLLDNEGQPIKGVFEQDPHTLPDGRIISAVHEQPGLLVSPYYTDDPQGLTGWTKGRMQNLPHPGPESREMEPSWFYRADGTVVMVFRDQAESFYKLASLSTNRGETWTTPVLTNMPDSRSKQSAGNLPDGTAFQVSNPSNSRARIPLVITLSQNGKLFDRAYLLRSGGTDLQPLRYKGQYKRVGFSYPKSVIWSDFFYAAYATNKEDAEITRVPLSSLVL